MPDNLFSAYYSNPSSLDKFRNTSTQRIYTTYCREVMLNEMYGYFIRNKSQNNAYIITGYMTAEFTKIDKRSENNFINNYKILFGVDIEVIHSLYVNIEDSLGYYSPTTYMGFFIKINPCKNIITKEMLSSMLFLLREPETRAYLFVRNITNVDIDLVLFRLLNRAKEADDHVIKQLQYIIAYLKFMDKETPKTINSYYTGCVTYMEYILAEDTELKNKIKEYIDSLIDKLKLADYEIENAFSDI